ncbi:MAG: efflux RND transporter permease subunit [Fimbriimonadaceae bacterium]|nr:efflux RND transporter permease subunit [Fimbriimonadaceae bacterium]
MGLTKVAITRPIFILMLMLAAVLMGYLSYTGMRKEQNPDVEFGFISVATVYPGAGPDEIATQISRKIEEAVSGINGLEDVTSTSQEGVSVVLARFNIGINLDAALNDTRSKIDQLAAALPSGAERPIISKANTSADPVLTLTLRSKTLGNLQLRDIADDKLKDRFARVPGVAAVVVTGGDEREIQIRLHKDRLIAMGIGAGDVLNAVRGATINLPSGRVVQDRDEMAVRVLGEFKTVEEIENMVISVSDRTNPNARPVILRLKDVATVVDASKERRLYSRLNGTDSVGIAIQKAKEGNAVDISNAIQKPQFGQDSLLKQIEKEYGIEFVVTRDTAIQIEESLFDLNFALLFGIFLVTVIVWVFLHNLRGTIIVGVAIPVCLMATFIVMALFGFTINNMSMLALSLAVGVLVDDAIVVLENIYRHLRLGESPVQAAINGRSEIGLAAIAITLADVVVFLPIGTMPGILGQFFRPLGLGFAMAVLLSLFVSFTVTPMLASRWYRAGEDWEHPTGRFAVWFEHGFERFAARYGRALEWSLHHRWAMFCGGFTALVAVVVAIMGASAPNLVAAAQSTMPMVMACVGIAAVALLCNLAFYRRFKPFLIVGGLLFGLVFPLAAMGGFKFGEWKQGAVFNFQFFPASDGGLVQVQIELPPGASLAATQEVVERVEKIAMAHPDAKYVTANIGSRSSGFSASDAGTNVAQVRITLHDKKALLDSIAFWVKHEGELRTKSDTSVAAELLEQIGRIPGAKVIVSAQAAQGFGSPIQMSFLGTNRAAIQAAAEEIRLRLAQGVIKGVVNADTSTKTGKPELRAIPDRVRLADYGLTTVDVAQSLRLLYEGNDDTQFRVAGREYPIRVLMDYADRDNPETITNLPVKFQNGSPVYLGQVATIDRGVGVDKIQRRNREEEVLLTADLLPGYAAGTVQKQIEDWMAKEKLVPAGVTIKPQGQADFMAREGPYLFRAFFLGLILVYMLLASLYNNLLYPLVIQLAQPQAMVGALLALILTDKTLNIVGFIGIIALIGLVGKNAILLVDYTNTLRTRGYKRHHALVEAGPVRLRPIMMTTLAVILGMLPVALAIGRGSEFRETIGIAIIGGIALSTILTLLIIPCSYTILDDLSDLFARLAKKPTSEEYFNRLAEESGFERHVEEGGE